MARKYYVNEPDLHSHERIEIAASNHREAAETHAKVTLVGEDLPERKGPITVCVWDATGRLKRFLVCAEFKVRYVVLEVTS